MVIYNVKTGDNNIEIRTGSLVSFEYRPGIKLIEPFNDSGNVRGVKGRYFKKLVIYDADEGERSFPLRRIYGLKIVTE